jgi:AcrR family transcriptional regulator
MEKLPRGRHGLSREYVARNQRERLLAAVAECVADVGYEATTVAMVSARASVSKSDYYQRFENKDECFAAAYDENMNMLRERIAAACESNRDWPLRVRDGLAALLDFLEANPERAKLLLVEGLRGGKQIYGIFLDSVHEYAERLGSGAPRPGAAPVDGPVARIDGLPSTISGSPSHAPSATDEAVVGGVASLVSRRVRTQEEVSLEDFLPELVEFALTPYVGAAEARRIGSQAMKRGDRQ